MNKGLEEVVRQVGGIKLWQGYPTINNQSTVILNDDIQDIVSANFSYGSNSNTGSASPFSVGAMVQPMEQYDQKSFMEAAAGFPNVGFGPPVIFFIYRDHGTAPTQTLPVPPQPQLSLVQGSIEGATQTIIVATTYLNPNGETTISQTATLSQPPTETVQVASPPAISNANGYNVYVQIGATAMELNNTVPLVLGQPYTITADGSDPIPSSNTATGAGTGGALSMQLYPNAMIGQVNVYYRARPLLWADTTATSWTNLDTSVQEAAILFAVGRVLANRQRLDEWKSVWQPEYDSMIKDLKESVNRRTISKSGRVRDVRGSYGGMRGYFGG